MAKAIAHITGTALRPGVSRNNRWYKPEHIAGMVASAQKRIGEGRKPMVMLSFHGAEDRTREITAALTSMTQEDDGRADFTADIIGTEAGHDIAALADSTDGKPALSTVSIRGFWTGKVRKERGPAGEMVETADGLELEGVDWTKAPGVEGAEIKTFAWASDGQQETTERVLITESVEGAAVTFTEDATPDTDGMAPGGPVEAVREAVRAILAPAAEVHALDDGFCVTCVAEKKGGKTPYGDVTYADPGYQKDKVKRYPLDSQAHVRSAWSYISMPKNAAKYSADQLKRIKSRIKAAMGRIGAKVAPETFSGFIAGEPFQVTEAVTEWLGGDPLHAGSWSIGASNGPVNLNLSSYSMDPAELNVILRAAADAACLALKRLDPDMGGDIDVPGAPNADTDGDAGKGETAPDEDEITETSDPADAGETVPAPAGAEEGDPAMAEETTTTGTGGAALTLAQVQEAAVAAVTATFAARDEAKAARKKAAREAAEKEAAETAARKSALTEALAELGIKIPAEGTAPAAETTETAPAALTEAELEKRIDERAGDMFKQFVQEAHASGVLTPARSGLVVREHAIPTADEAPDGEELQKKSDDDLMNYLGGAMAQQADLDRPVGAR